MRTIDVEVTSTTELRQLAARQVRCWVDAALSLLPEGSPRIDAHCHVGVDSDGSCVDDRELLAQLDAAGMQQAWCAPLHQVDGYAHENARLRAVAAGSGGRLAALHRCSPQHADPAADARAGLEDGALGLKWHPRAERFSMQDDVAQATAAVADEARVPILIHAGRGMERLGEGVVVLARRHPGASFVLAHAAISDLGWIIDATRDVPNLYFDTSWWRPTDIAVLLSQVGVTRVLHGSDPPYGTTSMGVLYSARIAAACGWSSEELALLMGGNARRIMLGGDAIGVPEPAGARSMPEQVPALQRAGELLAAALQVELGGGDPTEALDLAEAALHVLDSHPHADAARLLLGSMRVGRALLERANDGDLRQAPGAGAASPTWRDGIELLCATLVHLVTPALSIEGVDHVSWAEPAPFV